MSGGRTTYAILITDVYHFTQLVAQDEERVIEAVATDFAKFKTICQKHGGTVNADRGDSLKMVFESAVEAFRAAHEMQVHARARTDLDAPNIDSIRHRMGLHFGDVMIVDDPAGGETKVTGAAVTIAARLEEACSPGQICVSDHVYQAIRGKDHTPMRYLGGLELKNVQDPVRAWSTGWDDTYQTRRSASAQEEVVINKALQRQRWQFEEELRQRRSNTLLATAMVTVILGAFGFALYRLQQPTVPTTTDDTFQSQPDGSIGQESPIIGSADTPTGNKPGKEVSNADPHGESKVIKPEPTEASIFDLSTLQEDRTRLYSEHSYRAFANEVQKIRNWRRERVLLDSFDEASRLATGFEALKAVLSRTNGHRVSIEAGSNPYDALSGFDGRTLNLEWNGEEKKMAISSLTLAELEYIYDSLLKPNFGGSTRVNAFFEFASSLDLH